MYKLIYLEALAWDFSERHEPSRWVVFHYAMSHNSPGFVSVGLYHGGAGRHILVSFPFMYVLFSRSHPPTCSVATQYCDGLRGAFIVDDPNDPHASLYDVDDGTYIYILIHKH